MKRFISEASRGINPVCIPSNTASSCRMAASGGSSGVTGLSLTRTGIFGNTSRLAGILLIRKKPKMTYGLPMSRSPLQKKNCVPSMMNSKIANR